MEFASGRVYHSVSAKHLNELRRGRYNHREDGRAQFLNLIERAAVIQ